MSLKRNKYSIIKEIYVGLKSTEIFNKYGHCQSDCQDSEKENVKQCNREMVELVQESQAILSAFENYKSASRAFNSANEDDAYLAGFRVGVLVGLDVAEAYKEKEKEDNQNQPYECSGTPKKLRF